MDEKMIYDVSEWLLIIGGVNWGLTHFMEKNLVMYVPEAVQPFIYGAIVLAAGYIAYTKITD